MSLIDLAKPICRLSRSARRGRAGVCVLVSIAAILLAGCVQSDLEMRGVVAGFGSSGEKVFVHHEAVEDVMPEMTMPFNAPAAAVESLNVGDAISFTLHIRRDRSWISEITRIRRSSVNVRTAEPDGALQGAADGRNVLMPGDRFPGVELVDELGGTIRLPSPNGTPVLVDFIYTRCPVPDFCPLLSRRFKEIQDATSNGEVDLVSVTIDPEFDSPDVLARYATRYGADRSRWRFGTADLSTLERLYAAAGVNRFGEGESMEHSLATILLDKDGTVVRLWRDTDATAAEIIAELNVGR